MSWIGDFFSNTMTMAASSALVAKAIGFGEGPGGGAIAGIVATALTEGCDNLFQFSSFLKNHLPPEILGTFAAYMLDVYGLHVNDIIPSEKNYENEDDMKNQHQVLYAAIYIILMVSRYLISQGNAKAKAREAEQTSATGFGLEMRSSSVLSYGN